MRYYFSYGYCWLLLILAETVQMGSMPYLPYVQRFKTRLVPGDAHFAKQELRSASVSDPESSCCKFPLATWLQDYPLQTAPGHLYMKAGQHAVGGRSTETVSQGHSCQPTDDGTDSEDLAVKESPAPRPAVKEPQEHAATEDESSLDDHREEVNLPKEDPNEEKDSKVESSDSTDKDEADETAVKEQKVYAEEPSPAPTTEAAQPAGGTITVSPGLTYSPEWKSEQTMKEEAQPDTEIARELMRRVIELRRDLGPETAWTYSSSRNSLETINRAIAAMRIPMHDRLDLAIIVEYDSFRFHPGGGSPGLSAHLTSLTLRGMHQVNPGVLAWVALTPYTGKRMGGIGASGGADWKIPDGPEYRLRLDAFQPWTEENTFAIAYDGRYHGLAASVSSPLSDRFLLDLDAAVKWYQLGSRAPGGSRSAGMGTEGGFRATYSILRNPDVTMGRGFYDRYVYEDNGIEYRLDAWASVRYKNHSSPDAAVPVIENSLPVTIGLDYEVPLSSHWGVAFGGYVGGDSERNIDWLDLNGVGVRLIFVPNDQLRLWVGGRIDSETASGLEGGRTETLEFGLSTNF